MNVRTRVESMTAQLYLTVVTVVILVVMGVAVHIVGVVMHVRVA